MTATNSTSNSGRDARSKSVRMLAVTSDTYPPTRIDVSILFGRELAARGHRVDWLMQSESHVAKGFVAQWGGGTVWVGPTDTGASLFHRVRKHVLNIVHDLKLFSILRRGDYNLIEVKDKFLSGIYAILAARLFRKRFVYWLAFPFPEDYLYRARERIGRYPFLYWIRGHVFSIVLYRLLLPAADHVFAQSEQMRQDIAARGVPLSKVTAVPMGVEVGEEQGPLSAAERKLIPKTERCFLYLGALDKSRRLDFLVRVLANVRRELPDTKLYFVGKGNDPSDERLLADEARRLELSPAVVFVGHLPRADALQYVCEADVCVSPIHPSPMFNVASPTKLVEYMALGKAVVANEHPEQRLVIEQSGAGYCVAWDEQEFAAAIVTLLRSPETAKSMGARGRQYVAEHRAYGKLAHLVEQRLLSLID